MIRNVGDKNFQKQIKTNRKKFGHFLDLSWGALSPQPPQYVPGGRFAAIERGKPEGDTYGAGDCFAAGVTAGLAMGMGSQQAIALGCRCGSHCIDGVGAYAAMMVGL